MSVRKSLIILALSTLLPSSVGANERSRDVHVIMDISETNPIIVSEAYNNVAAREARERLADLELQYLDVLTLHTTGDPSVLRHLNEKFNRRLALSYHGYQPNDMPHFVEQRVNAMRNIKTHDSVDLIWMLEELATQLDCVARETHLIILSDGLDSGAWENGSYTLNVIPGEPFKGCASITYIGFGASSNGKDNARYHTARKLFDRFSRSNGFVHVDFIR